MARIIEVIDCDLEWKNMFKTEAKAINNILGKNCCDVEHIGSSLGLVFSENE